VKFRECLDGEILKDNICFKCLPGTYSIKYPDDKCEACLKNIECLGGNVLSLD
jgi:hypothetical protein